MLYPVMTESRLLIDLGGLWDCKLENQANFTQVPIPSSCNDFSMLPEFQNHCGWIFYQKYIYLPEIARSQRVMLRFESMVYKAGIWLNEDVIKEQEGSFLPFEIEITDLLKPGENLLLIGIDYVPTKHSDCGEIIGPVTLYTTPKDYIVDIEWNTQTEKKSAFVEYKVKTHGNGSVKIEIFDRAGTSIAHVIGLEGKLEIPNVNLWQPFDPYLYQAKVTFAKDVYILPFGVRIVQVKEGQFLLNGKPFYFKGYTRKSADRWDVLSNIRDLRLLKWQNANSFRAVTHPYSEEMMRLCDREGVVVIEEFSAKENCQQPNVMRDMISRDKNYACVVMWSVLNDTHHNFAENYEYLNGLLEQIRKEDPQKRPCAVSNMGIFEFQENQELQMPDVICLGDCTGNGLKGDLKIIKEKLWGELKFWESQVKPAIYMNYGIEAVLGLHDINSNVYTEEYQILYLKAAHKILDRFSYIIGEIISDFADNKADYGRPYMQGIYKGIFTKERKPKLSAYYLRSRWKKLSDFEWKK